MIEINTYLQIPNIEMPVEFSENHEDFFVNINDSNKILNIVDQIDTDYIEGAIVIKYYDITIIDFELWDLVVTFWAYLMNMVEEVLEMKRGHTYLPDQPLRIDMEILNKHSVSFKIGKGKYGDFVLPKKEFFLALINEAENVFKKIDIYFSKKEDYHLEQIQRLRKNII
ncbi:hypothetical protein [Chengkuizengella axinellae]|uniref:Uncharacterized protein n=1 Tax=Chengkuizengella axinellae TaxID=3064388 RepID=A0ABT9J6G0_9BACL|nr:hypothetical protein [Chengkuizengella sp. 2205SS18-9]MDP5277225.1 hypothetical protein [Chengkuizengella sp. 2205SS18-9]